MKNSGFALARGVEVGRWKVHDALGSGGQGAVWSVKPIATRRSPARALKACFAEDETAQARFRREVELLLKCDCPNVLKVHDHDTTRREHVQGQPAFAYYVSERCHGSLQDRQRDLGDVQRRLIIFRQACAAVKYLHGLPEPILHRDLKPANFLLAAEFENVVLADFGIARAFGDEGLTEIFEVVGPQHYRAPEVANARPATVRSDVYSLGRVLEWLLTGDVSKDLGTRPVPRGLALDDDACGQLDRIIAKATQAQAANRFESVDELASHLPELWLAAKPRPLVSVQLTPLDAPSVLNASLSLLRGRDELGIRELEQQVRREAAERLLEWRTTAEQKSFSLTKVQAGQFADELYEIIAPRVAIVLVPAYAGQASFHVVRRAIEDLVSVPGWQRGGRTTLIYAPRTCMYLMHHLHGALCLINDRMEDALLAAEARVPLREQAEERSIWEQRDLMGYPEVFGGRLDWAFEYLVGLRRRHSVLQQLFTLETDFQVGLAMYSLTLVLWELATEVAAGKTAGAFDAQYLSLSASPAFVRMEHDIVVSAARRVSGDRRVVAAIAARAGVSVGAMKQLWPLWKTAMSKYRSDERYWFGELPLGDLAE